MKAQGFEDLLIWQESRELVVAIYGEFKNSKDFGFRDQIQRAAVSVMNNIAEGYERKGSKEFSRFLYISKGSCGEVRSMLYIAQELGYIEKTKFENISEKCTKISKMTGGLIKKLEV